MNVWCEQTCVIVVDLELVAIVECYPQGRKYFQ